MNVLIPSRKNVLKHVKHYTSKEKTTLKKWDLNNKGETK